MNTNELFAMALGIDSTRVWEVRQVRYEGEPMKLLIELDFKRGKKFACPVCGKESTVHDTVEKRWRHMNFFQYRCEVVARMPRVECAEHGVRKELHQTGAEGMKQARWALLGNEATRSAEELQKRNQLRFLYPKLGRALGLKECLQDALKSHEPTQLVAWHQWARRSQIKPFVKLSRTVKTHWDGILAAIQTGITSGLIEAINGKIQLLKRMARGFKNFSYFQSIAYLRCSHLLFSLPYPIPT